MENNESNDMETGAEAAGEEAEIVDSEGPCKRSKKVHRVKRRHSEHDKKRFD